VVATLFALTAAVFSFSAPRADAASIAWNEPAIAISTVGNTIVETQGNLVEAINWDTSAIDRTVNGVTFDSQTTAQTGWNGTPVFNSSIYTDGNISGDFVRVLDSFMFGDAAGNPGTETLTLGTFNPLTAGKRYLVQLFVSDDRTVGLQTRTQDYTGGANTSALYENGFSYSLTGTFIADGATQDIGVRAFPGTTPDQTAGTPIINAFQVRQLVPEPSTLFLSGMALIWMALIRRRRAR
jgi:hypothetical protein